jgi:hypothetical protein
VSLSVASLANASLSVASLANASLSVTYLLKSAYTSDAFVINNFIILY